MTDLCHDPSSSIICDDKVWKIDRKFHKEVSSASNWIIDESIELQHHIKKLIKRSGCANIIITIVKHTLPCSVAGQMLTLRSSQA